jgi:hypothetical protein
MKKNILLLSLVALFNLNAKAQCPTSIEDDQLDGSSYIFTLASSADCSLYPVPPIAVNTITLSGTDPGTGMAATPLYGVTDCATLPNGVTQLFISANAGTVSLYSGNISFTVNGSLCTFAQVVLPITLVSFEGKALEKSNLLTWRTASETQNKGFDIEASPNPSKGGGPNTWRTIGFVAGHGTTNKEQRYIFKDEKPSNGVTYYRLKQLDFDGRFEYSKIVAIAQKGDNVVSVFPNPSNGVFTLSGLENIEDEQISIVNSIGQNIAITVQNDGQMDLSAYPSGVYYLRIASSGQVVKLIHQ